MRFRLGTAAWIIALVLSVVPVEAASGYVVDAAGKPVQGARACLMVIGVEGLCMETDENGFYRLPESDVPSVRIRAEGYTPVILANVDQEEKIVLRRAARLRAALVDDASGAPIAKGEVTVAYSNGIQNGPFPANQAGIHIKTLEPGEAVIVGRAEGYAEGRSSPVSLRGGEETRVEVRLQRGSSSSE